MNMDPKQIERHRGVIKFFDNIVKNIALYPPSHPSVKGVVDRMMDHLGELCSQREEVIIGVINGVLYVDEYLFHETTPYSESVLGTMNRFDVDDLAIAREVRADEILELAAIMKGKEDGREAFLKQLEEKGISNIGLKSFRMGKEESEDLPTKGLDTYKDAITTMQDLFGEIRSGRLPPLREVESIVEGFVDRLKTSRALLMLFSSLKGYDAYTYQHCVNVGILALLLAEAEGLEDGTVKYAAMAGMMHDIGKVKVPPGILNKPGGLTMREWEAIKAHPVHSAEVVRGMGGAEEIAQAVEGHHMHFDGAGYPVQSTTGGPSDIARLLSVVDTYDAITTVRSYKKPMNPVEALAFLEKGRGSKFDPHHVDALVSMVGAYPPGAMVRLSSNEIGVVTDTGDQKGRPVVRMILDENNRPYDSQWDLDLSREEAQGRVVASVIDPAVHGLEVPASAF